METVRGYAWKKLFLLEYYDRGVHEVRDQGQVIAVVWLHALQERVLLEHDGFGHINFF
jgi:hypothetical protein